MGSPQDPLDSQGREKIKCAVCGLYYHRVDAHAAKQHGISAEEYLERYPSLRLMSESAVSKLRRESAEREFGAVDDGALHFGVAHLFERTLDEAEQKLVPEHDESWVPGPKELLNLEYLALAVEQDENVLLVGPPGVGKTLLCRELAALCNEPLVRLPFNGEMRVRDLIGGAELVVDASSGQAVTAWANGPLTEACERGHWVLFDEFDAAPPHVGFVLHSVMEHPRHLTIMGRVSGNMTVHEGFRIFATANTLGHGDEVGLYAGTSPQNEALLDRFGVVIRMDYPDPGSEVEILVKRTGIEPKLAEIMVEVATKVREAHKNQMTLVSLSPRRLVAWASKTVRLGSVQRASHIAIINKLSHEDGIYVGGIIQRHFGGAL